MANKVLLKKSSVANRVPNEADLDYGEVALNYTDEKLYFKNSSNQIKSLNVTQSQLTIGTGLSGSSYNGTSAVTIAIDSTVATLTGSQTLTNKTLTSPVISGGSINNTVIGGTTAAAGSFTTVTATGDISGNYLKSTNSSGDEGGEILLYKPQTNSTIAGTGVTIDVYQNKLRIFEQGGSARGVFIDLTTAGDGVSSNLLAGGSVTVLTYQGDTGSDNISVGSETLNFAGGTGLTSTVANNTVTFDIDSTVATLTGSQTLTNKTITSPTVDGSATQFTNTTDAIDSVTAPVTFSGGVGIAKKLFVGSDLDVSGNLQIDGNLVVGGSTTTVTAQNLAVTDNMVYMNQAILATITNAVGDGTNVVYTTSGHNYLVGMTVSVMGITPSAYNLSNQIITAVSGNTFTIANSATGTYVSGGTARAKSNANPDLGFTFGYNDGTYHHGGFFRDATDGIFKVFKNYGPEPDDSPFIDTSHATFELAEIQASTFYGALSGNATTATTLQNARTISLSGDVSGSVSFNGSSDVTITTTIQPNSVALGTDTTGNYMVDVTAGGGISISHTAGEGSTATISHSDTSGVANLSSDNSGNTFIQDINFTFDSFGHVTGATVGTGSVTIGDGAMTVTAGSGLTGGGQLGTANQTGASSITLSHADTSSAANLTATSRTYVTGLTFDTYGHVTGYTTGSETVSDTNTTYTLDGSGSANSVNIELVAGGSGSGTDSINIVGAGIATTSWDEANQRITVTATEADTLATVTARGNTTTTTIQHGGLVPSAGTNIDQIYSVTDTLTLSTSWQDTSVNSSELATGTYIVQVTSVDDYGVGGGQYTEYYSGVMSWFAGSTNSTVSDEIPLHRAGHAPNSGTVFLRTLRQATGGTNLRLQIAGTTANTGTSTYTFKFRRMI